MKKLVIGLIILAGIMAIFSPALFYCYHFYSHKVSTNPLDWGPFGAFINGTMGPVIAFSNLMAVCYLAYVVHGLRKREDEAGRKLRTAFELHREFSAGEMFKSRFTADALIQEHPTGTLLDLYNRLKPEQTVSIFLLIRFYQRLWLHISNEQVDTKLVQELFGDELVWWWVVCFRDRLAPVADWQTAADVSELHNWFRSSPEFQKWVGRGEREADSRRKIQSEKNG